MLKVTTSLAMAVLLLAIVSKSGLQAEAVNVDCNNVNRYFVPCFGYLLGNGASPSQQCCANVKSLTAQSKGPVRAAVCRCIKRNAQAIPGLNPQRASALPQACGIPLGLKITPTTDCSRA